MKLYENSENTQADNMVFFYYFFNVFNGVIK